MLCFRFIWPSERIEHIAVHGITPERGRGSVLLPTAGLAGEGGRAQPSVLVYYCLGRSFAGHYLFRVVIVFPYGNELPFWDTYDSTDFESKLDVVDEAVFVGGASGHRIVLRLSDKEAQAVHAAAQAQGVDEATVIREWIWERDTKAAN